MTANGSFQNWFRLISILVVSLLWIWPAIRTAGYLTRRTVPFRRRTIWAVKVLAIIIGAGGTYSLLSQFRLSWIVTTIVSIVLVVLVLSERVCDYFPPKPPQDVDGYEPAWQQYRRLRRASIRSWLLLPIAILVFLILLAVADSASGPNSKIIVTLMGVLPLASAMAVINYKQWKWHRWPCPRCGCSFRSLWIGFSLKRCRYCGLPLWGEKEIT
jgi:hypothetical protein